MASRSRTRSSRGNGTASWRTSRATRRATRRASARASSCRVAGRLHSSAPDKRASFKFLLYASVIVPRRPRGRLLYKPDYILRCCLSYLLQGVIYSNLL